MNEGEKTLSDQAKATRLIDVAKEVGMSRAAVARVLLGTGAGRVRVSEASSKKIREAAKRLNYEPNEAARQLKGKGRKTLAVVILDNAPPVVFDRICAMEKRAWEKGYEIILCRFPYQTEDFITRLSNRKFDGLIVMDRISKAQTLEKSNHEFEGIPTVFHSYAVATDDDYGVIPDVYEGTRIAAQHLADIGRKRIALVSLGMVNRIKAWRDSMIANNLPADESLCLSVLYYRHRLNEQIAEKIIKEFVINQKVDALLVENDYWAARILQCLKSHDIRVPEDVAIVGYNNLDFSEFLVPALTTIDEDNEALGTALVDQLLLLIEGNKVENRQIKIQPKLIIRKSTS